ncbi:MAG: L-ribulose-5-phosphate 4-epimerase AraD [Candidatus Hydrogenedentes bacterium]|nr:L-ribulose-5-phosphate 4-epimerase AraD [Candidatus Hydrogenedentota bacterium]
MRFQDLKEEVCRVNQELIRAGLATLTWGNASGLDPALGVVAIKPSGVHWTDLTPERMVVLDLETGTVVEGGLKPSSDTATHLHLYRAFAGLGGIVHTHSAYATAFAQAGREIPCLGTTHADHFYGNVPVVRELSPGEVADDYERNTGVAITDTFATRAIHPLHMPAALCPGHGPFVWGASPGTALENAIALEAVAKLALLTLELNPSAMLPAHVLEKHFQRKHGPNAYYGQQAHRETKP